MPKETFHCSVITPEAKVYDGDADFVVVPAHDGQIGILRNRAPLVCQLGAGRLSIHSGEKDDTWFIDAGFAQVLDNQVIVLTQKALRPTEIDKVEAIAQLEAAHKMSVTDEIGERRKARAEASARAKLRLAD